MKLMFMMIKIGVPAVMAVCLSCCSGHTAGGGNELKCRVMEVEALAAGRLVCRKLADGQAPALSREEVESCLTDTGL